MKLNLGCGSDIKPGFINIDNFEPSSFDQSAKREGIVYLDLRQALPYEDNSCDFIFSEHFIEHLPLEDAERLFKEIHRVLKPGAKLRLSTPDLDRMVSAYLSADSSSYRQLNIAGDSPCFFFNLGMRHWGHQYIYSPLELQHRLIRAGFMNIQTVVRSLLETRPPALDFIMEATKT